MATSGEMTAMVAEALAMPHATVVSYCNVLRSAGLIKKGGRGKSAAQMRDIDVARLVIALLGSDALAEGVAITELIGQAYLMYAPDPEVPEELEVLRFEDAFSQLLRGKAKQLVGGEPNFQPPLDPLRHNGVSICINSTELIATFRIRNTSIEFYQNSSDTVSDPNDWESMSITDKILSRALIGSVITTRSIPEFSVNKLSRILL